MRISDYRLPNVPSRDGSFRSAKGLAINFLGLALSALGIVFFLNTLPAQADDELEEIASSTTPATDVSQDSPIVDVRATLKRVVEVNEALEGKANTKERREKLREIISKRFDFAEMSKRSLGPEWSKRSESEQDEFTKVFSELLASTYLDRVETATSRMLTVDKEKVDYPRAIVRTTVTDKGESFPIDYKLHHDGKLWRVYDVVVENIGLVANYRNEFAGIIRKDKFDGLMKLLNDKVGSKGEG